MAERPEAQYQATMQPGDTTSAPVDPSAGQPAIDTSTTSKNEIYMDNLPASMSQQKFEELFAGLNAVKCVFRQHQTGTRTGFGFATFRTHDDAASAVRTLSNHEIEGHNARCMFAKKPEDLVSETNLYVCNLPITYKKEDLEKLFGEYGEISETRILVDSKTNKGRGVGFVHYKNKEDAKKAIDALSGVAPEQTEHPLLVKYARENKKSSKGFRGRGPRGGRGGYGPQRGRYDMMGGPGGWGPRSGGWGEPPSYGYGMGPGPYGPPPQGPGGWGGPPPMRMNQGGRGGRGRGGRGGRGGGPSRGGMGAPKSNYGGGGGYGGSSGGYNTQPSGGSWNSNSGGGGQSGWGASGGQGQGGAPHQSGYGGQGGAPAPSQGGYSQPTQPRQQQQGGYYGGGGGGW